MDASPVNPALVDIGALAHRLVQLGSDLAGALQQETVTSVLMDTTRDLLCPAEVIVSLVGDDATLPTHRLQWPDPTADRADLLPRLALPVPATVIDDSGHWMLTPFRARGQVRGFVALRDPAGPLAALAPDVLAAIGSEGSIAIERAELMERQDDGRCSWQEVVDALVLAICIVDETGSIRRANRAFAELIGATSAQLPGKPWTSVVPTDWTKGIEQLLASPLGQEAELRTATRSYAVSAAPLGDGATAGTVLLFHDQTDKRRLQQQLMQSAKLSAMGQLIAGVAHELNNPLASVVGFADFLGEMPDIPLPLREPLAVIREEAERASHIVRNLLNFARTQNQERKPADLEELLEATTALVRSPLMASRVDARLVVEPGLPPVMLDRSRIQQIFVNLLTNAAQAIATTGKPGTVLVAARRFHDGIAVTVQDDGPGMPAEVARRVFDPFFTTKGQSDGTGLGLPISQGIAREHGGRITLATEPGHGATFTVYLPLGDAARPPAHDIDPVRPLDRRLRVLVVDDEPHILHYMRATLEAWGHHVDVAAEGAEGLKLALTEQHDLVICDLRMPQLGGREIFDAVMRERPHLARRIFFATGDTVRGDTLQFLESLDRPWLHKPFSLAELRSLLATAARMASGRDSAVHHRGMPHHA